MSRLQVALAALLALSITACEGPRGPEGAQGAIGTPGQNGQNGNDGQDGQDGQDGRDGQDGQDGQDGDKGDPGDPGLITEPPRVTGVDPASGSPGNVVTLRGSYFSADPSAIEVWFDGEQAEILSSSETEVQVRPPEGAAVDEPRAMQITVIARKQASNSVSWMALPSGTIERIGPQLLVSPKTVAPLGVGSRLLIADGFNGFFRLDADTGMLEPLPLQRPAPIATHLMLAEPGGRSVLVIEEPVYSNNSTPTWGVLRYYPSTGVVEKLSAVNFPPQALGIVGDELVIGGQNYSVYAVDLSTNASRPAFVFPDYASNEMTGIARVGDRVFFSTRSGGIFSAPLDGSEPASHLELSDLGRIDGMVASGTSLRALTDTGEKVIDPVGLQATVVAWNSGASSQDALKRMPDGRWVRTDENFGVLATSQAKPFELLEPILASLSASLRGDVTYLTSVVCVAQEKQARGIWKLSDAGMEPALPDVCAATLTDLDDGRILFVDIDMAPPGTGRLTAFDPATGATETLLEDAGPVFATAVADGYAYLLSSQGTVDRLDLATSSIERGWGTTVGIGAGVVVFGDQLVLRTTEGLERIDLATGGLSQVWIASDGGALGIGEVVADGADRLLLSEGFALREVVDGELVPFALFEEKLDQAVYTIRRAPNGDLVLVMVGGLARMVP